MIRTSLGGLMTSDNPAWNTPQEILTLLHAGWPDGVDLDPCHNDGSIVDARFTYAEEQDGLAHSWDVPRANGLVYVNPPYGKPLPMWADKVQAERSDARNIVVLVPARTDTRWWRTMTDRARYVIFLAGRLRFLGAPAPAPFPSALIVHSSFWRRGADNLAHAAAERGAWVVKP